MLVIYCLLQSVNCMQECIIIIMFAKPDKFHIKMYMVSEHESVYTGTNSAELVGLNATLDLRCTVTMKMVMGLLESTKMLDQHRTLFFDNYFSSAKLCEELLYHESYACCTVHPHCKGLPKAVTGKKIKLKKGEVIWRRKTNMLCLGWFDK